jgi:hypothetical protein
MTPENLNTEMLLQLMAKLQFIAKAAREKGMTAGRSEPRYDAVEIKAKDLLNKLDKLIPAVMLSEIGAITQLTKDLYKLMGEEESETTNGRGN